MSGLALTAAGWTAFGLAAALVLRSWHATVARGEALARACHEVRGPLTAARLGLEATAIASSTTYLRAIEAELDRATVALDELQGAGSMRLESGEDEMVDVRSWLTDSVEAWRPVAEARGMEVRLHWRGADAGVWGHRSRLARVTGNLIANAIDHGDGYVEVRGRADETAVVVEVLDGGAGLNAPPPALLEGGPRRRGPGRRGARWGRGQTSGRGRGLLIARAVAEAHGGRLTTAPSERGARFVVTLPLAGA